MSNEGRDDLFPKADDTTSEEALRIRLPMAQAFVAMLHKAYDALLHYGINYRDLPAYKDQTLLDEAKTLPLRRGQVSYLEWMKRVRSDIEAAIRRKMFNRVK